MWPLQLQSPSGSGRGLGSRFPAPCNEGIAGLGKLGDGHPASLSDEVGHSSQFLWGYVDELASVINHTCGDRQVVGLSPAWAGPLITASDPPRPPLCLAWPGLAEVNVDNLNSGLFSVLLATHLPRLQDALPAQPAQIRMATPQSSVARCAPSQGWR